MRIPSQAINTNSSLLIIAGVIAAGTGIWHWLCIFGGLSWYANAHAPRDILESVKQGTLYAPVTTVIIGGLFVMCTLFAFSGAGIIRKVPLLKSALITIALICLVRGGIGIVYLVKSQKLDQWELIASPVWFFCGVCFLLGFIQEFKLKKITQKQT